MFIKKKTIQNLICNNCNKYQVVETFLPKKYDKVELQLCIFCSNNNIIDKAIEKDLDTRLNELDIMFSKM